MGCYKRFEITTPRSSHVGQPGYDSEENWRHFIEKYRNRLLRIGEFTFRHHAEMAEDVFEDLIVDVVTDPFILVYEPNVRFRTILCKKYLNKYVDAIRALREKTVADYIEGLDFNRPKFTTQDDDQRRLMLLAIDFIRRDMMRDDFQTDTLPRGITTLHLDIWRALQEDDETYFSVAKKTGHKPWRVFDANRRMKTLIENKATELICSLHLI